MFPVLTSLPAGLSATLRTRASLRAEILALRHQLGVLWQSKRRRIPLRATDPVLWVALCRLWPEWRSDLVLVKPDTVIARHRRGFRLYWRCMSRRGRVGRPETSQEIRSLIREMNLRNVLWGALRLHGELLKLGFEVSRATAAKYMVKGRKPPSQTWRTFLENHLRQPESVDFFVGPTASSRILHAFLVVAPERKWIVHFNVTEHPTAEWTAA